MIEHIPFTTSMVPSASESPMKSGNKGAGNGACEIFLAEIFVEYDLNFYAAHHLSPYPGKFRGDGNTYNVMITGTDHAPPPHEEVSQLMQDFVARAVALNQTAAPSYVAAYVLWRLNWIHPFAQGNGRTARATSYFILCQRYKKWFPGTPVLELIRRDRDEYCSLLAAADKTVDDQGMANLVPIQQFLERLLIEQIESVMTGTQAK